MSNHPEAMLKPSPASDFRTVVNWFQKQPTYRPDFSSRLIPDRNGHPNGAEVYTSIHSHGSSSDGKEIITLPKGQQNCTVSLEGSPSKYGRVFSMQIIIDDGGNPLQLDDSTFYAWARLPDNRDLVLKYEEVPLEGSFHAELVEIRDNDGFVTERGVSRYQTRKVSDEEKLGLASYLNEIGYPSRINYVETAKKVLLATSAESLENPFVAADSIEAAPIR